MTMSNLLHSGPCADDEVEVVEVFRSPPALSPCSRNSKRFMYSSKLSNLDRSRCRELVQRLGATSVEGMSYNSSVTHILVPSRMDAICLAVLGCLATGKFVVTPDYLLRSWQNRRFLPEWEFIPVQRKIDFVRIHHAVLNSPTKVFEGKKMLIVIQDENRQRLYKNILRDAGATVLGWTLNRLNQKSSLQIGVDVDLILTEPLMKDNNPEFKAFLDKVKRSGSGIPVLSYFYLFRYVLTVADPLVRDELKAHFDIDQVEMMEKLHPRTKMTIAEKNSKRKLAPACSRLQLPFNPLNKRPRGIVQVVDLAGSSSSDNDDDDDDIKEVFNSKTNICEKDAGRSSRARLFTTKSSDIDDDVQIIKTEFRRVAGFKAIPIRDKSKSQDDDDGKEEEEKRKPLNSSPNVDKFPTTNVRVSVSSEEEEDDVVQLPQGSMDGGGVVSDADEEGSQGSVCSRLPDSRTNSCSSDNSKAVQQAESTTPSESGTTSDVQSEVTLIDADPGGPGTDLDETIGSENASASEDVIADQADFIVPELCDLQRFVRIFEMRTRTTDECIEVTDARTRTFRFDRHKEAKIANCRTERGGKRLLSQQFPSELSEILFSWDNKDNDSLQHLTPMDVEELGELMCCSWYLHPKHFHRLTSCLLSEASFQGKSNNKSLALSNAIVMVMLKMLFLHVPTETAHRDDYLKSFQLHYSKNQFQWLTQACGFQDLVNSLIGKCRGVGRNPRVCRSLQLLEFVVKVLTRDFEFWWKHLKKNYKKNIAGGSDLDDPLITALVGGTRAAAVDYGKVQCLVDDLSKCWEAGPTWLAARLESCLRQLISMVGLYCAVLDRVDEVRKFLDCNHSSKATLAKMLFKALHGLRLTSHELYAKLYLIRPSWLGHLIANLFIGDVLGRTVQLFSLKSFEEGLEGVDVPEVFTNCIRGDNDLHVACREGDVEKTKQNLTVGNLSAKNQLGRTPIHEASYENSWGCLKAIQQFCDETPDLVVDWDEADAYGASPFALAIHRDATEVQKLLLRKFLLDDASVNLELYQKESKPLEVFTWSQRKEVDADGSNETAKKNVLWQLAKLLLDKMTRTFPCPMFAILAVTHRNPTRSSTLGRLEFKGFGGRKEKRIGATRKGKTVSSDSQICVKPDEMHQDIQNCISVMLSEGSRDDEKSVRRILMEKLPALQNPEQFR